MTEKSAYILASNAFGMFSLWLSVYSFEKGMETAGYILGGIFVITSLSYSMRMVKWFGTGE